MKRRFYLIVVLLVGTIGMPGCDDCKCPEVARYADIIGLGSFVIRQVTANSESPRVKANDKLSWENIVYFSTLFETRVYGHRTHHPKPSWGMAAYACDCIPPGYLGSEEKLVNLTVKTVYDFDRNHPAGSVMNDITSLYNYLNNKPLSKYLSEVPVSYNQSSRLDLVIDRAPASKGPFALDVTVELDNGETYTTRTPIIELI